MAETFVKQLEAEIEQLNRLVFRYFSFGLSFLFRNCPMICGLNRASFLITCQVCQREEDTRSTKMMLRFREDKIRRMESLVNGSVPVDSFLLEENRALSEEIQLLQAKLEKNPEVTRFASENIRLLDQLGR